jgi:hypothetical protein
MAKNWNATVAEAMKVLGKQAEMPDFKMDLHKVSDQFVQAVKGCKKSVDDFIGAIITLQGANLTVLASCAQVQSVIQKADFGLDEKNKDDAKKIAQARKILGDYAKNGWDNAKGNVDELAASLKKAQDVVKFIDSA